jgi:hypothetical protein
VIEATSTGGRQSDFFCSRKISSGQFGTFATISAITGLMQRSKEKWRMQTGKIETAFAELRFAIQIYPG